MLLSPALNNSGCRLAGHLPETHHTVVFANDGAPTDAGALWFPEGLEGLESLADFPFWQPQAAEDAKALSEADDALDADERPYLLDLVFSVNGRKPSRGRLVTWLLSGGVEELAAVSNKALRIRAVVADADDELGRRQHLDVVNVERLLDHFVPPAQRRRAGAV